MSNQWCQYKTDNFTLFTDLGKAQAVELSHELNKFHAAVGMLLDAPSHAASHIKIVAFADPFQFLREMGQRDFIGFMQPSLYEHTLIFARETRVQRNNEVAFHEYAHYLIRSAVRSPLPRWFEEGLAQYLSTIQIGRDGDVTLGRMPRRQLLAAVKSDNLSWRELINTNAAIDWSEHGLSASYRISWALVHYLVSDLDDETKDIRSLADNAARIETENDFLQLLQSADAIESEEFDQALRNYYSSRRHKPVEFVIDVPESNVGPRRCLPLAEKYLLLGTTIAKSNPDRAKMLLERANAKNAQDPYVLVALARINVTDREQALELARRSYESDPSIADTNIAFGNALVRSCEDASEQTCRDNVKKATKLFEAALNIDPIRVDAVYGLGIVYLMQGRPGDALNYLRVVERRAPWSSLVNYHLGDAYAQLGQVNNARSYLQKAVQWETDEDLRSRALDSLNSIQDP